MKGTTKKLRILLSRHLLQADLDSWIRQYNEKRFHCSKDCFGKTRMQTFLDSTPLAKENTEKQRTGKDCLTIRLSLIYYKSNL